MVEVAVPLATVVDVAVQMVAPPLSLTVNVTVPSLTGAVEGLTASTCAVSVTLEEPNVPVALFGVTVVLALLTVSETGTALAGL